MPFVPDKQAASGFVADQPAAPPAAPNAIDAGLQKFHQMYSGPEPSYEIGGKATDIASRAGLSPGASAALGFGTNVGLGTVQALLGGEMAKGAAVVPSEWAANKLMWSALKPEKYFRDTGKAQEGVQTLLEKGINVSKGGYEKLTKMIDDLNSQIKGAIARSKEVVDKNAVAKYADSLAERVKAQVNPGADMATVKRALDEWLNHPMLRTQEQVTEKVPSLIVSEKGVPFETTRTVTKEGTRATMPVQIAQEIKSGTYAALGKKSYGELKGADEESQKILAHGLKQEIARLHPEVDAMNAQESKLLNARLMVQARNLLEMNKNPMGLGWLSRNVDTLAAWVIDRNSAIKSMIANTLHRGGIQGAAGQLVGGAVAATGASRPATPQRMSPVTPTPSYPAL